MESFAQENRLSRSRRRANRAARATPLSGSRLALLSGPTGYVGGRLFPRLLEASWRVRCLARRREHLLPRVPVGVEVVQDDLLDAASLLSGVRVSVFGVSAFSL